MVRTDEDRRDAQVRDQAGGHHHHMICRECGTVADVACATVHTPCLDRAASAGFTIERAEVTFLGRCAGCRAGRPAGQPGPA
ncbi:MAG TPA: transcriptional repressor [Streptosporangiaceae bacterium]|nr:transcriptional repressor [Streptosporangiaceae bacterium]